SHSSVGLPGGRLCVYFLRPVRSTGHRQRTHHRRRVSHSVLFLSPMLHLPPVRRARAHHRRRRPGALRRAPRGTGNGARARGRARARAPGASRRRTVPATHAPWASTIAPDVLERQEPTTSKLVTHAAGDLVELPRHVPRHLFLPAGMAWHPRGVYPQYTQ